MRILLRVFACLVQEAPQPASAQERARVQAVLTQAAECNRDGSPGPGNQVIADIAQQMARWHRHNGRPLPIVPQYEITLADSNGRWFNVVGTVAEHNLGDDRPATTWQVCTEQAKVCRENGWTHVLVVALPEHLWRACAVYRRLGLTPIPAPMPQTQYYSWGARRWYLRSRLTYRVYERLARLYFLKKGWI